MNEFQDYNFERQKGESKFRHLVRICVDKLNKEHDLDWFEIIEMFGLDCAPDTLRKKAYGYRDFVENEEVEKLNKEEEITYKETTEILSNGSYKSDKLLKMSEEQSKDVNFLLEAHGFDKEEWELVNARNNIWNVYSKQDGVQQLYSSKITVKPKTNRFDMDKLLEVVKKDRKPIEIDIPDYNGEYRNLLEIPLYDMHFGVSSLEYYKPHLSKILKKIHMKKWNKILIVVGQDLLHNDNFRGQTARGTQIEKVDMVKAFDEALDFYITVISEAIKESKEVECIYVKGNHDESMSYGLFRTLQATFRNYPEIKFNGILKQRTPFVWEKVFIGLTHGDKGHNRIVENFISEYGKLIADAEVKEIHSGHLHVEKSKDNFGITHRTLSTANKTDEWHDDNGFVGANKRFQLFEYSPTKLEAIYYI